MEKLHVNHFCVKLTSLWVFYFSLPIDVNHGNIICILTYTRVSYIFLNLKIFKSGHFLHGYKQTKLTTKKKKLAIIHILVIVFP